MADPTAFFHVTSPGVEESNLTSAQRSHDDGSACIAKLPLAGIASRPECCVSLFQSFPQTKCLYIPPHGWNIDFPLLMLRAKAVKFRNESASMGASRHPAPQGLRNLYP
jgi:hypothetical protein